MLRHLFLAVICFYHFDISSQRSTTLLGQGLPCQAKDYVRKINLSSPGCPVQRVVNLPTKKCVGTCKAAKKPGTTNYTGDSIQCFACEAQIKKVTAIVPCINATNRWNYYRQLEIVTGCSCKNVCKATSINFLQKLKRRTNGGGKGGKKLIQDGKE